MGIEDEEVEIFRDPAFTYGQKVRSKRYIKNDGTFRGREIGDILVRKGDIGYIRSIGTFLQRFYIYGVDWIDHGYIVGMRRRELELVDLEAAVTGDQP
ncbi:MAG: nitrogen fixation protein NifZ [Alphaproteobacteria bacterium]|nr:nitrogen fixation protein NifZ [Alphaproteobacteria bacterium]TAD90409.1 MAG: nitrogen fixation protein NifZ [Alphaproteobacteria bacterium]